MSPARGPAMTAITRRQFLSAAAATPCLGLAGCLPSGDDITLRKAFRFDSKAAVEACPEILPGNRRGQLDHLLRTEMLTEAAEQFLWDIGRRPRQHHRVMQDAFFQFGERGTRLKVGHVG